MEKECKKCQEYIKWRNAGKYQHPCVTGSKDFDHCDAFTLAWTRDVCLEKYPRLVSHLICESLGYFCPLSAANAVSFYKQKEPFFCEWFSHMAQFEPEKQMFDRNAVMRVQKETLRRAFKHRHHHKGYMAEYKQARHLVAAELKDRGCTSGMLASWF